MTMKQVTYLHISECFQSIASLLISILERSKAENWYLERFLLPLEKKSQEEELSLSLWIETISPTPSDSLHRYWQIKFFSSHCRCLSNDRRSLTSADSVLYAFLYRVIGENFVPRKYFVIYMSMKKDVNSWDIKLIQSLQTRTSASYVY